MAISHPVFEMRRTFEFKHPTTVFIAGPTMSGKTRFLLRALKESLFSPMPTRMIWVYSEWQADYDEIRTLWPKTEFVREMGSHLYNSLEPDEHNMVIIDDKMSEEGGSGDLANLFTKGAHHRNLTVVFIVQNMFHQAKSMRTISLNSHYMVLFKNPRDRGQIQALGSQVYPGHATFLAAAFMDATKDRYSYLILDFHPDTAEELRVRTGVFENEIPSVYLPAQGYKRPSKRKHESNA